MKFQIEVLSYILFSLLSITISSFIIYYFWFFSDYASRNINKINLYSFLTIFESPLITFNSICTFCKVVYSIQFSHLNISSSRFLFLVYFDNEKNEIRYEEAYSRSFFYSSLFNNLKKYNILNSKIFASSIKRILFEINNIDNTLLITNI